MYKQSVCANMVVQSQHVSSVRSAAFQCASLLLYRGVFATYMYIIQAYRNGPAYIIILYDYAKTGIFDIHNYHIHHCAHVYWGGGGSYPG